MFECLRSPFGIWGLITKILLSAVVMESKIEIREVSLSPYSDVYNVKISGERSESAGLICYVPFL